MFVRVIKGFPVQWRWKRYNIGDTIPDYPDYRAHRLIMRGRLEEIIPPKPKPKAKPEAPPALAAKPKAESATAPPLAERADVPPVAAEKKAAPQTEKEKAPAKKKAEVQADKKDEKKKPLKETTAGKAAGNGID